MSMTPLLDRALTALTSAVNVSTGLAHSNDKNRAKDTFRILKNGGVVLGAMDIEKWALAHQWKPKDAKELGALGASIGLGKRVRIDKPGSWWRSDILDQWKKP